MNKPQTSQSHIPTLIHVIIALVALIVLFQILGASIRVISSVATFVLIIALLIFILILGALIAKWTVDNVR